jgi:hypothetical protein
MRATCTELYTHIDWNCRLIKTWANAHIMASTASRVHYCHGSTTSRGHQRHGGNATRAPTPQGHQRHGGSGPRTTAMGAHSRAGTNATGAQGHWLLPRGAQDLVLQPGNLYILEDSSSPVYLGVPGPPFFLPGQVTAEATLRESQTASQTASTASDGHTYNPVLTGIHRAPIADSALQFWSGNFPALMRTRHRTPMSIQQHGLVTAWRRRSATWM